LAGEPEFPVVVESKVISFTFRPWLVLALAIQALSWAAFKLRRRLRRLVEIIGHAVKVIKVTRKVAIVLIKTAEALSDDGKR